MGYGFAPGLVAGKDFVAGQLVVGIQEGMGIQELKQGITASGVQISKEIEGALLLQFASEEAALSAVSGLIGRPDVAFVERNGFMRIPPEPKLIRENCGGCDRAAKNEISPESVGGDPGTSYQWHHNVIRKTASLPSLSSTPPVVAVIDTGVDYKHVDLTNKVILGKNCVGNDMDPMDDHGNGTHVAGSSLPSRAIITGRGYAPTARSWRSRSWTGTEPVVSSISQKECNTPSISAVAPLLRPG